MLLNQYQEFINNNFNNTNIKTVSEQDYQIEVKFYHKVVPPEPDSVEKNGQINIKFYTKDGL